jgi:hypothetical protein
MTATPMTPPRTTPTTMPALGGDTALTLTGSAAESVIELLELCEQFLRTASPAVHAELAAFLTEASQPEQPRRPDPACLIDLLGFHHLWLQAKLANADTDVHHLHRGGGR